MKLTRLHLPGLAAALLLSTALGAHANSGTTAGTEVTNTIDLSYSVGNSEVTVEGAATRSFAVDRKVDFEVDADSALVIVNLGESEDGEGNASFTLTNLSNAAIDYALGIDEPSSDYLTGWRVLVNDAEHTVGDPITVPQDGSASVTIIATFAAGASEDNNYAFVVSASVPGLTESTLADIADLMTMSTVFLFDPDDLPSGQTAFRVEEPQISATKTVSVISGDPDFNCGDFSLPGSNAAQPAIPGACIEYEITVSNNGGAAARGVSITDQLPAQVSYVGHNHSGNFFTISENGGTVTATAPNGNNLTSETSQSFRIRATIN